MASRGKQARIVSRSIHRGYAKTVAEGNFEAVRLPQRPPHTVANDSDLAETVNDAYVLIVVKSRKWPAAAQRGFAKRRIRLL